MEGSWVGDRTGEAFRAAGYDMVCARYHVPFVDLQRDTRKEYDAAGMNQHAGFKGTLPDHRHLCLKE